jgi:hypothetical protein
MEGEQPMTGITKPAIVSIVVRSNGRVIYEDDGKNMLFVSAGDRDKAEVYGAVIEALNEITGWGTPPGGAKAPVAAVKPKPELKLLAGGKA